MTRSSDVEPRWTQIDGDLWEASFPVRVHVRHRERGWPGLGSGDPPGWVHAELYEWAIDKLMRHDPVPSRVLDIGCGSGYGLRLLRERFAVVDGVDSDHEAVAFARRYVPECHVSHTPRDVYHGVVMIESIEHAARGEVLDVAVRHLTKKGLVCITTPRKPKDGPLSSPWHAFEYGEQSLTEDLEKRGFVDVKIESPMPFVDSLLCTARLP